MANVKISELTALASPGAADVLPIVDVVASTTKKATVSSVVTTGAKALPRGTAGAPAVAFNGALDPNTGIYSPGADQVAISTGGSGRLFVDASGRVGVGSAPSVGNGIHATINTNNYGTALVLQNANVNGWAAEMQFLGITTTDTQAKIGALATGPGSNSGALAFYTANAGSYLERLRITSAGLVGVGTSAPGSILSINGTINAGNEGGLKVVNNLANASFGHGLIVQMPNFSSGWGGDDNYSIAKFTDAAGTAAFIGGARSYFRGSVGIGTSSPAAKLHITDATGTAVELLRLETGWNSPSGNKSITWADGTNVLGRISVDYTAPAAAMRFGSLFNSGYQTSDLMTLTPTGLGIGTTSPGDVFDIAAGNYRGITIKCGTTTNRPTLSFFNTADSLAAYIQAIGSSLAFGRMATDYGGHTESARIDSSGRLLVGTSSSRTVAIQYGVPGSTLIGADPFPLQIESGGASGASFICNRSVDNYGPALVLGRSRGANPGGIALVASNDNLGSISFNGADGTDLECIAAAIRCDVDGTPGADDMPGRLVFSTTADGASSPTERMRIVNSGGVRIAQGSTDDPGASNIAGIGFGPSGFASLSRTQGAALLVNRTTDDGALVAFRQDGTDEGSITVSGTTVSYNGAHLSRWSQLSSGAERTEILRGTVLSNIDEMCEWEDEDNEQLNRMKVSDIEGDKNVSGVFQAWDDDDDTYTNDFYCAMTGDFIIRIGAGVTIERGDLLMSAGDGTAKPQDDDIIRSKTIAKVTSTNVSCTYDDGSYCVPCVLMAC